MRTAQVRALLLLIATCTAPSCGPGRPGAFPGIEEARAFQYALRRCLSGEGIKYSPVIKHPGSDSAIVPAPIPAEWWASHGGYGLIADQAAEVVLDPGWRVPN